MAGARWQLQEAKNRLSEVVRKAQHEGPQTITLHGKEAVVIVSAKEFARPPQRKGTLIDFFRTSPLVGVDLGNAVHSGNVAIRRTEVRAWRRH